MAGIRQDKKIKANDHDSYGTFTILSIVIPIVGFILGVVYLTKDKKVDKKLGEHMLAISVLFSIIWGVLLAINMPESTTTTLTTNSTPYSNTSQRIEDAPSEQIKSSVPAEYRSALAKANSYSNTLNMSKKGLYEQLTSEYGEKFSKEAAQYAIDNVNADWKANALAKAKTYQDEMNMSPAAIYDQLISDYGEKFTKEEADYAMENLNN